MCFRHSQGDRWPDSLDAVTVVMTVRAAIPASGRPGDVAPRSRRDTLVLAAVLAGCGSDGPESETITVFAAASLTQPFTTLGEHLADDLPVSARRLGLCLRGRDSRWQPCNSDRSVPVSRPAHSCAF